MRSVNTLLLNWYTEPGSVDHEAFRPWVVAGLKGEVAFDAAVWGRLPAADGGPRDVMGAYLYGVDKAVLQSMGSLWLDHLPANAEAEADAIVNLSLADSGWQGARYLPLQRHAQRFGLQNALVARCNDPAGGGQFVMLARRAAVHRFSPAEALRFELLAPHMMQSFAARRKAFLATMGVKGAQAPSVSAAAIVDRAGYVHDQHTRFATMLRREWSDWPGRRLPEPLLDVTARRAGAAWRFVGMQISADFLPVDDVFVVTARPRRRTDGLTEREGEIALRYAAGGSFREVAESLNVSPATVRSHLRNVFGKLQIRNKVQLAAMLQ